MANTRVGEVVGCGRRDCFLRFCSAFFLERSLWSACCWEGVSWPFLVTWSLFSSYLVLSLPSWAWFICVFPALILSRVVHLVFSQGQQQGWFAGLSFHWGFSVRPAPVWAVRGSGKKVGPRGAFSRNEYTQDTRNILVVGIQVLQTHRPLYGISARMDTFSK